MAERPERPRIDPAVAAQPAIQAGEGRCKQITGYLYDPDPAGRVVRAGPSRSTRALGRLLPPIGEGPFPASFEILRSRDGWLEIEGAGYDESLTGKPALAMFTGRGWIWGGGVSVGLQSKTGFAEPSHRSALLVDLGNAASFDWQANTRIVGCDGRWVLVEIEANPDSPAPNYRPEAVASRNPLRLRSWVAGVCNIQETTCDGVNGDFAESSHLDRDPNRGD